MAQIIKAKKYRRKASFNVINIYANIALYNLGCYYCTDIKVVALWCIYVLTIYNLNGVKAVRIILVKLNLEDKIF
jgi:hypothetical protein